MTGIGEWLNFANGSRIWTRGDGTDALRGSTLSRAKQKERKRKKKQRKAGRKASQK